MAVCDYSLTQERLKELLNYDQETGTFTRLVRCGSKGAIGRVAGYKDQHGYIKINVLDHGRFYAHRLAWFYVHGHWPQQIDHINCDRSDNRLSNLREATDSQNRANRALRRDCKSGVKGVCWHKGNGLWQARITVNGHGRGLGYFRSKEEAGEAYRRAAQQHFGEFART